MSSFRTIVFLLTAGLANSALGASPHLSISLTHGDAKERATQNQLERLLSQYDLTQWIFTTSVVIDEDAIPHSHPILTLHTRHLRDDDLLLSTFIHEQAHWFFDQHHSDAAKALSELRGLYPSIPVGFPEGPMTPMEIMSISSSFISNTKPTEGFSENLEPGKSCRFGPKITTRGFIALC
jgi:hypothetical protein